ncbi:CPBP family intramembrane metalloprotease [Desertihabitans brevis]|uniref:CPBP family intramembrane metalloprotease n=2 Tax=Desertihabitans brevis TaxID=2268447 RepID=A0A367YYZ9_9ACTN|nr:CPBP family intramembrane metalloprotease [Desertihabitans brevis]
MTSLRRHPLATFLVLAFGLPWLVWVPRALGVPVGVLDPLSTWLVAVAAVLAALLSGGRAALRDLGRRLLRWRAGWVWYAVVLVGPALFTLLVTGVVVLLGGRWADTAPPLLVQGSWALLLAFLLVATLTDGLGEEVAWRGFALPRLLERLRPVPASLLLGLVWGLWHLPLLWTEGRVLYQQPLWLLLLDITAKSVLFTWVFVHTDGSVLLAALFHAATNVFVVSPPVPADGDLTLPLVALGLKWVLVALVLGRGGLRGAVGRTERVGGPSPAGGAGGHRST